ncbi:AtpZ/AtpI family protein [Paenibacillus ehimensis]|uniref:AtpZ/AtpI family protein n=1 Tax=Paenibacillus ehimensis TaxID=79264 RepID=A0ABT8VIZ8_9BACL|nr:AtpZ/AtpI family protein [Paenibacillus ehimensis]MDO3680962.1 AtpZ/AtpI family protein [Paenibacillus ehimensis]MEC0213938.1 AtpZ/AtpI family protein [Paenibacillus ehimensis]
MNEKDPYNQPWRAAALVSALGIDIVVCTTIGYFIGSLADKHWGGGTKTWVIGGVLIGFAIGIFTVVLVLKRFLEDKRE